MPLLLNLKNLFRLSSRTFMFKHLCFFLLVPLSIQGASLEVTPRRIQALLALEETSAAVSEARELIQEFPDSPISYSWWIRSFAVEGEEEAMMKAWEAFHTHFPEQAQERELLEDMCWGILHKGRKAGGMTTQLISLLGAAMTQQMRAVNVLKEGIRNSNSLIRSVATSLAALYADLPLKEEIVRLFREEKVWEVQKEVLQAISKLRMTELLPDLMLRLNDPSGGLEEKKAVIDAIVHLRECVDKEELQVLLDSKRAVLRILAAELIAVFHRVEDEETLRALLKDPHPDVKISALKAYGLLRLPVCAEVQQAAENRIASICITAAWALLLAGDPQGEELLHKWLVGENKEGQLLAAGAIAASGRYGVRLAAEQLEVHPDPYVRANLGIALLKQRTVCEKACIELDHFLQNNQDKWMWQEDFFPVLKTSTLKHQSLIPNYPEVVNQTVRLEILNLLSILEYPGALDAVKRFLKERRWGVTGIVAELLLGEGDENALTLVRELLEDPDREVRTESALVLAAWGHDSAALPILTSVYHQGDRGLKLKVLEAIGRIGDPSAIPFLLERLKESSQVLRLVAACVLIQTLNH